MLLVSPFQHDAIDALGRGRALEALAHHDEGVARGVEATRRRLDVLHVHHRHVPKLRGAQQSGKDVVDLLAM